MNLDRTRHRIAVAMLGLLASTGCTAQAGDPDASPVGQPADAVTDEGSADGTGSSVDPGDLGYLERLTPVAMTKNATDIRVEGADAWVTVPVDSSSSLECLQLLPARGDGETLTVIYSDGVEELCEWP